MSLLHNGATSPAEHAKLEARRQQMVIAYLGGATQAQIAQSLGLSVRHIKREMGRSRAQLLAMVDPGRKAQIISEELEDFRARRAMLWRMAQDTKLKESVRQDCLLQLREEQKEHWRRLQSLGLVPKEQAPVIAIGENVQVNQSERTTVVVQWGDVGVEPENPSVLDPERVQGQKPLGSRRKKTPLL